MSNTVPHADHGENGGKDVSAPMPPDHNATLQEESIMATANSTASSKGRFFIKATQEIVTARGARILPGDNIMIDPYKIPDDGDMVLIGESLFAWEGQDGTEGVATTITRAV